MSLQPGTTLGPYCVTAKIGEGGMGEVYQARDTKLDRDVALKVLPEAFSSDPDRLARFEREAKVLASLNHPNIGSIYGLEEAEGTKALVLELVEGPTLADRIAKGPIPIDEALPIAKQIAEALEAAHEAGVIHRDLKPANIKVREDGTVKVLDFGLAKALDPNPTGDPSEAPTLTAAATQMGVIMGTAAYMSPEQARGKPVDRRADIWAFGAVLFEMLTGQRVFKGRDVSETLGAVLQLAPDWNALPEDTPARVSTLLRRCLEKEPKQRVHDVADVRIAMEGGFETTVSLSSEPAARRLHLRLWQRPVAVVSIAVAAAIVAGIAVWSQMRPVPTLVTRFPILLGDDHTFTGVARPIIAITPQGDRVVFTGNESLWTRAMDQSESVIVPGTERTNARVPFFSPDGQSIGFYGLPNDRESQRQLVRLPVSGGVPIALAAAENPWGASWAADDTIFYGQRDGIWRVPATGGEPRLVIPVEDGAQAHGPQLLPDGDSVLFTLRPSDALSWDAAQIVVQSLSSTDRTVLIDGGRGARYLPTGHVVYVLDGTIRAQAFDPSRLAMLGGPVALVEGIRTATSGAAAQFSVSDSGSLVYVPDDLDRPLVWVDHDGNEEFLDVQAAKYWSPRVSPKNGTDVAVQISGRGVWIADSIRGTLSRLTDETTDRAPIWTRDGEQLVYTSDRDGNSGLVRTSAEQTGEVERLASVFDGVPQAQGWSPDGSALLVEVNQDIGILPLQGDGAWEPLLATQARETEPSLSPDGKWLAYMSDVTGRVEVYLRRFPDLGERQTVSTNGGLHPMWSPNGRALYYLSTNDESGVAEEMMGVSIDPGPPLSVGTPEVLFRYTYFQLRFTRRQYDLAPDGERFLMVSRPGDASRGRQINVVLNWFTELTERVPVP